MGKLTGIEAARGIAAVSVVMYHVTRHFEHIHGTLQQRSVFQFGHAGVDLFFVISGFIIYHVHCNDFGRVESFRRYAFRRFTRIMPIYWVAFAATLVLLLLGRHGIPDRLTLLWSFFLLPGDHHLVLGVAWTLQHEIVFYVLMAFFIINRSFGLVLFTAWIVVIFSWMLGVHWASWLSQTIYSTYNLEFMMGIFVARYLRTRAVSSPMAILSVGVILFSMVGFAEDFRLLDGYMWWARFLYGPTAAIIVMGLAASGLQGHLQVAKWMQVLGSASYAIYLFQFIFIGIVWKSLVFSGLAQELPQPALFVMLSVAGIGGGILVSRFVELPLMRLVRGARSEVPQAIVIR